MVAIPEGLTFEEAAPGSEGSHDARSSIRAAKVRRGQDVLVLRLATPAYALDGCGSRPSWVSSETWS